MKVLVTAASHHGATIEVADAIARRLTSDGFEVVRKSPEEVDLRICCVHDPVAA